MFDPMEILEPRRMLSAVAAHVAGSTLKITGTPGNDAIVVSLKGTTLNVNANGASRQFAAAGVKLIDIRGKGGQDKLRIAAPIASRLNGGPIRNPLVTGQLPTSGSTLSVAPDGAAACSLTKTGAGTLNLNGGNAYTGGNVVYDGALHLNGNNAFTTGAFVNSGTLNPNCNVDLGGGALNINAAPGGVFLLNPGGALVYNGTLNLGPGGAFNLHDFALNAANHTSGLVIADNPA